MRVGTGCDCVQDVSTILPMASLPIASLSGPSVVSTCSRQEISYSVSSQEGRGLNSGTEVGEQGQCAWK